MMIVQRLDKAVLYCLFLYALSSSISIAGANIAISFALLFAVIRYNKESIRLDIDKGLVQALSMFLLAVLISAIFSYDPLTGLDRLWAYFYRMTPLLLAVFFIKEKRHLINIIIIMGVSLLIADGYALWQGIHGNYKASAFSSHPMIYAGYLTQMIPLLLVIGFDKTFIDNVMIKRCLLAGVMVSLVAFLFTGVRGAWIAVSVAILIYLGYCIRTGILSKRRIVGLVLILVLIIAIGFSNINIVKRFETITDMNYQSNSERVLMWTSAWNMFLDHPVTGIGAGNYPEIYQTKYILPEAKERLQGHAHNNFLQIMAETGIVGLSAFVYMFGYILVRSYQMAKTKQSTWALAVILVTISLLIQGVTEYNFGDSAVIRMYWFIIGLAWRAYDLDRVKG